MIEVVTTYRLYLETELTGVGKYELMQSRLSVTECLRGEIIHEYETTDRLLAAIVNLGKACAFASNFECKCEAIILSDDSDGRVFKYNGEHKILYSLMNPSDKWQALKHQSLYNEYRKYLHKISIYLEQCPTSILLEN